MPRLNDLSISTKVAAAPVVVAICLLVSAGSAWWTNQRTGEAVATVASQGLPNVVATTALNERATRVYALVMQSLAYEGAGMKQELIASIDKRMLIVTDIERLMSSRDMELIDEAAAN